MKHIRFCGEYLAIEQGKMDKIIEISILIFIFFEYFLLSHFHDTGHFKKRIVGRPDVG